MALNSVMRLRRRASSSVVWVRSPVKTMKSGFSFEAFTACTVSLSVLSASGLGGPLKPQCESDSWRNMKSSGGFPLLAASEKPGSPDPRTTPPNPRSFISSRRSNCILLLLCVDTRVRPRLGKASRVFHRGRWNEFAGRGVLDGRGRRFPRIREVCAAACGGGAAARPDPGPERGGRPGRAPGLVPAGLPALPWLLGGESPGVAPLDRPERQLHPVEEARAGRPGRRRGDAGERGGSRAVPRVEAARGVRRGAGPRCAGPAAGPPSGGAGPARDGGVQLPGDLRDPRRADRNGDVTTVASPGAAGAGAGWRPAEQELMGTFDEHPRGALHAYLDGELSLEGSLEVEAHLAECGACRRELETYRALRRLLVSAKAS